MRRARRHAHPEAHRGAGIADAQSALVRRPAPSSSPCTSTRAASSSHATRAPSARTASTMSRVSSLTRERRAPRVVPRPGRASSSARWVIDLSPAPSVSPGGPPAGMPTRTGVIAGVRPARDAPTARRERRLERPPHRRRRPAARGDRASTRNCARAARNGAGVGQHDVAPHAPASWRRCGSCRAGRSRHRRRPVGRRTVRARRRRPGRRRRRCGRWQTPARTWRHARRRPSPRPARRPLPTASRTLGEGLGSASPAWGSGCRGDRGTDPRVAAAAPASSLPAIGCAPTHPPGTRGQRASSASTMVPFTLPTSLRSVRGPTCGRQALRQRGAGADRHRQQHGSRRRPPRRRARGEPSPRCRARERARGWPRCARSRPPRRPGLPLAPPARASRR